MEGSQRRMKKNSVIIPDLLLTVSVTAYIVTNHYTEQGRLTYPAAPIIWLFIPLCKNHIEVTMIVYYFISLLYKDVTDYLKQKQIFLLFSNGMKGITSQP